MNFENLMYKGISQRFRVKRKHAFKKQTDFIAFIQREYPYLSADRQKISNIERNKRLKDRNPYLFSENSIEGFSQALRFSDKSKLIWGEEIDKHDLIRLILLKIFMNGTERELTPFFDIEDVDDEEFVRGALFFFDSPEFPDNNPGKELTLKVRDEKNEKNKKFLIENLRIFMREMDDFFCNGANSKNFELLNDDSKSDYEKSSNLILKILFGNLNFATSFLEIENDIISTKLQSHEVYEGRKVEDYSEGFLYNKGNYSLQAIDYKRSLFVTFIKAFYEMYEHYKKDFLDFFDKHIFSKGLERLKLVNNERINNLIQSSEFLELLERIYQKDQYVVLRMSGHNYARAMIQNMLVCKKYGGYEAMEDFYDISRFLKDSTNVTLAYSKMLNGEELDSIRMYLPRYCDISEL